ncbi:MAG TPA: NAD(P)/FAD-dependent oxidoreductase [Solirubrobacteraceae bacterium]|nr:NAD(P)/FAD-dependent oxidoreductase [Solirubrobacteraceae bacterium]
MGESIDVVVVGAGQAGLAVSHELGRAGIEHLVLERGRIAQAWRGRWQSFCLVTPNWSVQLPGFPYRGSDPDGFMPREEVVGHLEGYAAACDAPVREGIAVSSLERRSRGFRLETSAGSLEATDAIVCTGAYQRPHRPAAATSLPEDLLKLDVPDYRSPSELPAGPVLVIGSGQSGCQIAEELHQSGRTVFMACGRAGWSLRRLGDRDFFWWAREVGDLDDLSSSLPSPAARLGANLQASGHGGGHDLHYRTLQHMGVTLLGHFLGTEGRHARFAPDLADSVAWGDERNAQFMERIGRLLAERGLPSIEIPKPAPLDARAPESLDLTGFGAAVFAGGFRPDYGSWLRCPEAFDELGFPIHEDGTSSVVDGLHFAGVHFLRKRKSSLLIGVGEDAAMVASRVAGSRG